MNWKQFKIKLLEQNKNLCFIDRIKTHRGLNEVRILRFFFCGDFKPYVDKYNAIGFYCIIEKNHYGKYYELDCQAIEKDTQKGGEYFFRFSDEVVYNKAIEKISEMMRLTNQ